MRLDRNNDELRLVKITRSYLKDPRGSVLIEMGQTKLIISATIEDRVPRWLHRSGKGWLSGEYDMLPGSTKSRKQRLGQDDSRSVEISRLIGRSLRTCINLDKIGERTIWIDCDVIQADGGTRCAAITGAYVALYEACFNLYKDKVFKEFPLHSQVAAVSVGKVEDQILLDLNYLEDSKAQVDANIIMNTDKEYVEIQSSAEAGTFSHEDFLAMLDYGKLGVTNLFYDQDLALADLKEELETLKDKRHE